MATNITPLHDRVIVRRIEEGEQVRELILLELLFQLLGHHREPDHRELLDPIARHEYAFLAARRIGVEPDLVQRTLARGSPTGAEGEGDRGRERRFPGHVKAEREALSLLLNQLSDVAPIAAGVDDDDFTSSPRRELFRLALSEAYKGRGVLGSGVAEELS